MTADRPAELDGTSTEDEPGHWHWWVAMAAVVGVAAWLRLCNLGSFSLALDEVTTMTASALSLREILAVSAADVDNVPLNLIIAHCLTGIGLGDPWIRLVPIAAGLLSIVAWTWWVRRHFGATVSLLFAGLLALSTFHIRYSQELRAYPYLLAITSATMLAGDNIRRRPDLRSTATLAVLVTVGCFLHHSYLLIFVPLVGMVWFSERPETGGTGNGRRGVRRSLVAALALGTVPYGMWLGHISNGVAQRLSRGATQWTLELAEKRWQFLTVAAFEGEPIGWLAVVLGLFAVIGFLIAFRHPVGRRALIPAAAAIVAAEALLVAVNRWSKGRYDTALWPFLMLLVVLGLERTIGRFGPTVARAAVLLALAIPMAVQIDAYQRLGRPHWDRMGDAIEAVRRSGEPVLAENHWSRNCTEYYVDAAVTSLARSPDALRSETASAPSVLVVAPDRHRPPDLRRLTKRGALIATIPRTGSLYRLRSDMLDSPDRHDIGWPMPASQLPPLALERPIPGCLSRAGIGDAPQSEIARRTVIDFEPSSEPALRSGWSAVRRHGPRTWFAWAMGREAAVVIWRGQPSEARLIVELWPVRNTVGSQRMRAIVNSTVVGESDLRQGVQRVIFGSPASAWRRGSNLVVFQFSEAAPGPSPGGDDTWYRSAGVQLIEVS